MLSVYPRLREKAKQVNVQAVTASPGEEASKARSLVGRRHSLPVLREEPSATQNTSVAGHSHVSSGSTDASLVRRVEGGRSAERRGKIGEGESVPGRGKSCGLGG